MSPWAIDPWPYLAIRVYTLITSMFSWDTVKAAANLEKHRISFEEAAQYFQTYTGWIGKT